jgi:hypothetical protein
MRHEQPPASRVSWSLRLVNRPPSWFRLPRDPPHQRRLVSGRSSGYLPLGRTLDARVRPARPRRYRGGRADQRHHARRNHRLGVVPETRRDRVVAFSVTRHECRVVHGPLATMSRRHGARWRLSLAALEEHGHAPLACLHAAPPTFPIMIHADRASIIGDMWIAHPAHLASGSSSSTIRFWILNMRTCDARRYLIRSKYSNALFLWML